jgi:hypothetical protein
MRHLFFVCGFFLLALFCKAQDTLPKFTVKNLGNDREGRPSVVISWVNPFDTLSQISIQTSHDSLRNYRTLITLTDPNAKFNGFADRKAPHDHMYYRLFVVKTNGQYFFSNVSRPHLDTSKAVAPLETAGGKKPGETTVSTTNPSGTTGTANGTATPPVVKKPEFVPSFYVYTNKEGYVYINLPDAEKKKYRLRFFEEDNSFLFEVKNIRQTGLTLDKTNFLHSGWFHFELYADDDLVEKHRLFIGKDF